MDSPEHQAGDPRGAGRSDTSGAGPRPPRGRPRRPERRAAILNASPAAPGPSDPDPAPSTVPGWTDEPVDHDPAPALSDHAATAAHEEPVDLATDRSAAGSAAPLDDLDVPDRYRSDQFDDLDEFEEFEPAPPLFSGPRGRRAALLGGAAVLALASYAVGWSRGSADLDRGTSPTTSIVAPPTGDPSAPGPTQPLPDALPLPVVNPTIIDFDDGVPADVDGRAVRVGGEWTSIVGGIAPSPPDPLPAEATDPRLLGQGPDLLLDGGQPAALATVKLATPTPLSGIVARHQDDDNYWAAVLDQTMTHVTLYEVLDGVQTARGFVQVVAVPGTTIGLFAVDGKVGVTVDGQSRVLSSFFGPQTAVEDQGIAGNGVGLLTGTGTPAFDDLTFG